MLKIIVISIFIVLLINIFLKKIHLPTIIGYITTGTVVAYLFNLHGAHNNHDLKEIGEFGVVFLMFTIGLEFSIVHLKRMKNEVFVAGGLQILITTAIFYIISYYLIGLEQKMSFVVGIAISLSSTAIVLKTFNETGEISKRYGQRALGILIMQDIAVIPILIIISFMGDTNADLTNIAIKIAISVTILLFTFWFIGRYLLETLLTQIVKTNSDELFTGTILFLAIGASYLSYLFGFSYSLGAFIAGMLIAETKYNHQAEATLTPFRDLLLGVFFVTVGMQINFTTIFAFAHVITLVILAVVVLKFFIIYAILRFNETKRTSLKTAMSLVQIGEFSLVVLELARGSSLISATAHQILIVSITTSMILTPLLLKNLSFLTDLLSKDAQIASMPNLSTALQDHIIIIGFGEFGKNIARVLRERGEKYIAIENNVETFNRAENEHEPIIFGNATKAEIIKNTNPQAARKIIIAIDNLKKLIATIKVVERYVDNDKIVIKIHNEQEKVILKELGVENIIVENTLTSAKVLSMVCTRIDKDVIKGT